MAEGWVFIGGSRRFADAAAVEAAVAAAKAEGLGVVTGCARGADALAVAACVRLGVPCRVFCAGDVPGHLFGLGASFEAVTVRRWAGGGPEVPAKARLARRTVAGLRWAASAGCRRCVVFFAGSPSPGSALSCRVARSLGLPLVVFGLPAEEGQGALPL